MKLYIKWSIALFLVVNVVFYALGQVSEKYTNSIDEKYAVISQNSDLLVPSIKGSAMGLDYIYDIDIDKQPKMVIYGASTSILGLIEEDLSLDYELINASSGSASIQAMVLMQTYLESRGMQVNEEDLIKIDITPTVFKNTKLKEEVLTSALEYASIYEVKSREEIKKSWSYYISLFYGLNARKIEKAKDYLVCWLKEKQYDSLYPVSSGDWRQFHRNMDISLEAMNTLKQFILNQPEGQVVVDLMYENSQLLDSTAGNLYNDYIDNQLIPFLEENAIAYIDSRQSVADEYFLDATHLSYAGRSMYSQFVDEQMQLILGEKYE